MPTTRPTLAPEKAERVSALVTRGRHQVNHPLFFDDSAAVMYRKIDTTPLFATFPRPTSGLSLAAEPPLGRPGSVADLESGSVLSTFIFSRMTHRHVFAPAGAFSERMIP
jgi:hypothetical protein